MKNKKIIIILVTLIVLIGGIFLVNNIYQNKNKITKNKKRKQNNLAIMIKEEGATDYTKSSSKDIPKGDYVLNEEKTHCENNGKILSYDNTTGKVKFSFLGSDRCYLYFDYKEDTTLYGTIKKRYDNNDTHVKLYGELWGEKGASTFTKPVYYFNGIVQNNNVLFGGFCWKIVRTTDTGGIKLIYNGEQKDLYKTIPIEASEYVDIKNDGKYPFSFDEVNKTWTSTNKLDSSSGTIYFKIATAGNYIINYSVSTAEDKVAAYFYKNGKQIGFKNGIQAGTIILDDLIESDIIMVVYSRGSINVVGDDSVTFSINKLTEEKIGKTCDNVGTDSQIGSSKYNLNSDSIAYAGYMYNTVYTYSSKYLASESNIVFGNSFTYSNGTYTLQDTITVEDWASGYNSLESNRYTCLTTGTSCTEVYYVFYVDSSMAYYMPLTDGKTVDDAINEMLYADDVNTKDSTIKSYIDSWYKNHLTSYSDKLEDTIFCNERGLYDVSSYISVPLEFQDYTWNYSLICPNETDRFSMSNSKAKLTYPIGLLSGSEVLLAYRNADYRTYYLNSGTDYWVLTPKIYDFILVNNFLRAAIHNNKVRTDGGMTKSPVDSSNGVRPSVSLKPGTEFKSGDGSFTNPFIIE